MHAACSASFAVAVCLSVAAAAGQPHEFSGTWVAVADPPKDIAAAPSPVFGARFSIKMDAAQVTLTRIGRDGAFPVTLPLDGSEVRWRVPGRLCEGDSARVEKIAREEGALAYTLVGTEPAGGGPMRPANAKYILRPESADTITVHGMMVQLGARRTVATVYKRSAETLPAASGANPSAPLPNVKLAPATISQAAWIAGTWTGTASSDRTIEERWTPPASGAMLGLGRSLRGSQMTSFEFLCVTERDGSLAYSAMPNGRSPATLFMLTSITPDSVTFENPAHDYPRLIRYTRLPDGSLETTISAGGNEKAQSFVLKRQ
jgi:hypothetical protein